MLGFKSETVALIETVRDVTGWSVDYLRAHIQAPYLPKGKKPERVKNIFAPVENKPVTMAIIDGELYELIDEGAEA